MIEFSFKFIHSAIQPTRFLVKYIFQFVYDVISYEKKSVKIETTNTK